MKVSSTVEGRLVRSAETMKKHFPKLTKPRQKTLQKIEASRIASDRTIERHGRDLLK